MAWCNVISGSLFDGRPSDSPVPAGEGDAGFPLPCAVKPVSHFAHSTHRPSLSAAIISEAPQPGHPTKTCPGAGIARGGLVAGGVDLANSGISLPKIVFFLAGKGTCNR